MLRIKERESDESDYGQKKDIWLDE